MAWELSATESATVDIEKLESYLESLAFEKILEIKAEIHSWESCEETDSVIEPFDEAAFCGFMRSNNNPDLKSGFIREIMEYALDVRKTTDNGGFNLHLCPYGCHTTNEF